MKLRPSEALLDNIRQSIIAGREKVQQNRDARKVLIREIRTLKHNIKVGENLCSKLEDGQVVDVGYIRADLRKKRETLDRLRQDLLTAEVDYSVTRAIGRVLHEQLDRLNEPFDPQRAKTAGRR